MKTTVKIKISEDLEDDEVKALEKISKADDVSFSQAFQEVLDSFLPKGVPHPAVESGEVVSA